MKNTSEQTLHIVSFDVPFPPDYGGVIDVFYKIKALNQAGIAIKLHCFEYGRAQHEILNTLSREVFYYKRKIGFWNQLSLRPYIVNTRQSPELLGNLLKDNYPILFEGLHTTAFLAHPLLKNRLKIYRESNIEHQYYFHLARANKKPFERIFFGIEALRLRIYQKILRHADIMLAVSEADTEYLRKHFPKNHIEHLPSFHGNEAVEAKIGKGTYILYHGNLSVAENYSAALYLINQVFSKISYQCIIAGKNPPSGLYEAASSSRNIEIIANPNEEKMRQLIADAQIHVLFTQQPTGLKLKLLNTLYKGRHCLVNNHMLAGTRLRSLCHVANQPEEMITAIHALYQIPFTLEDIGKREQILGQNYSDKKAADYIIRLMSSKS